MVEFVLTRFLFVRTIDGMNKRRRVQKKNTREEYLEVRLDSKEKQAFKDAAELAGVALSAWVRLRLREAARKELRESGRTVAFMEEEQ